MNASRLLALALILASTSAHATIYDLTAQTTATLASAQTTTGLSAHEADFGKSGMRGAAVFQLRNAGTGSATVELQINCVPGNTDWAVVANSATTLAAGAVAALDINRPGCRYRTNVSACAATCSVTVNATSIGQ
jgi:hypothetical protein